jgi:hypothetical protein
MTIVTMGLLVDLSGYLGMRLHSVVTENSALRAHIASLKRQLGQRR